MLGPRIRISNQASNLLLRQLDLCGPRGNGVTVVTEETGEALDWTAIIASMHEADLEDGCHEASEERGLEVFLRGAHMTHEDGQLLARTGPVCDVLLSHFRSGLLLRKDTPR